MTLSIEEFITELSKYLKEVFKIEGSASFSQDELTQVHKLAQEKYKDWNWNFAYGPSYTFEVNEFINNNIFSVKFEVVKGAVSEISFLESSTFESVINNLKGVRHDLNEIGGLLRTELDEETATTLTNLLF